MNGLPPIRVAHLTTIAPSLRYLLLALLVGLQKSGFQVLGISSAGADTEALNAAGIRHLPVSMTRRITPLQDLFSFAKLYRTLRRERLAILHTHTPKGNFLGQMAACLARVPVRVSTVHGFYQGQQSGSLRRAFYWAIETVPAWCADSIFLINRTDLLAARRMWLYPHRKAIYLEGGTGVNTTQFDRARLAPEAVAKVKSGLGLSNSDRVVAFVGRLVREKGVLDFIGAAREIRRTVPSAKFLLIGAADLDRRDGKQTSDLLKSVKNEAHFIFAGFRSELAELYAAMDVLVLPSYREGLPRCLLEASAMQVPCVVTNVRGCNDVIEHGRNGLVCPLGDVPAIAQAVIELLNAPEKAQQMGLEGRRRALERFDERGVLSKVRSEYLRLLSSKGLALKTVAADGL